MNVVKVIFGLVLTGFDVFILTILAMAIYRILTPTILDTITSPSYEPNVLVALIFARIIYVMLNHMGVISIVALKVKPQ